MRALAESPILEGVRDLDLSSNPLGSEGLHALARSPHAGTLQQLGLRNCRIDDEAAALVSSSFTALSTVRVSEDSVSPEALGALRERFGSGLHR
jgi:hypothetical protein